MEEVLALSPDIILVDFLMPGQDGIEFVSRLREAGSTAKCIICLLYTSRCV